MKVKSLLAIALVAAASSNAFSMEIVKGKLLSIKTQTTANVKPATFNETAINKNTLAALLKKHKNDQTMFIYARDQMDETPDTIKVGDSLDIRGRTNVFLDNDTTENKKYKITQSICYDPFGPGMPVCSDEENVIQLDAGGYVQLMQRPEWKPTFTEVGRYIVSVETTIEDNVDSNGASFHTEDYRMLTVEPTKK